MRKILTPDLSLYFVKFYPYKSKRRSFKRHKVTIGIGGNIGNVIRRFKKLFLYLKRDKRVDIMATSPVLKNPPFGYLKQSDFYNAVIELKTNLSPKIFLKYACLYHQIYH